MQQTNFSFEIIIGDDASQDLTPIICKEYVTKFPKLIDYELNKDNLGMIGNWFKTIKRCNGKFIAMCEGDDYWTDSLKLQKQVDFLEANPDYSICFHRIKILKQNKFYDDTKIEARYNNIENEPVTVIDLLKQGNFIHTPSVVFRNDHVEFPIEFKYSPVGDYFLHIINAQKGYIRRLDDIMAVYRDGVGIYSSLNSNIRLKNILIYQGCILGYLSDYNQKEILLEKFISNINRLDYQYTNSKYLSEKLSYKVILKTLLLKIKNIIIK